MRADTHGTLTTTGSSNAYLLAATQTLSAYAQGDFFMFEANHTNTGAATLNVDSVGVDSIVNPDGTALIAGQLTAGGIYGVIHDGTNWQLLGGLGSARTFGSLDLTDVTVVDLSNAVNTLNIGATTGQHLAADGDEIQSKSNATTAGDIAINRLGGEVNIGPQSGSGSVSLYDDGGVALQTNVEGVAVRDTSGTVPVLSLRDDAGTILSRFQSDGTNTVVRNVTHGGTVSIQGEDGSGNVDSLFVGDPGADVSLYHAGVLVFRTRTDGIEVDGDGSNIVYALDDAGTQYAVLTHDIGSALYLRSNEHGVPVRIQGEDAGGTTQDILGGDPDGAATLYYAGTEKLRTDTDGATVFGDDLRLDNTGAGATRIKAFNSEGGFILLADGDTMQIRQADASGTDEDTWIAFANNAGVTLYNNNTAEFNTQDSDASGNTTGAQVKHHDTSSYDVGLMQAPVTNVTAAHTLQDVNAGKHIRITSGTGDIDITTAATDLVANGTTWSVANVSGSNNTIDANTGITLTWLDGAGGQTGDRTLADGGVCTILKVANTSYEIWGNGIT
jgi:hypothetical protein